MSENQPLVAEGVVKGYVQGSVRVDVLQGVSFSLRSGELVALTGRSGSGKSTLLHVLAGLEDADGGSILVAGQDILSANVDERAAIRNRHMGFIYQFHHLLPEFTALENAAMPLRVGNTPPNEARDAAAHLLTAVGLAERLDHRPAELSGGERQRVAVARALVATPRVVLADEPTGNLDRQSAEQVLELMQQLCSERDVAMLLATHDDQVAACASRVIHLQSGTVV